MVARQRGDLVSVMIGTNEWDRCLRDPSGALHSFISELRAVQSQVPVVIVTPLVSWREGKPCSGATAATPEVIRKQLSDVVSARRAGGDAELYLVDGMKLVPGEYMSDGLHPDDRGMKEIALNLNAEMGFARIQYEVVSCPKLTLALRGLEPGTWFDVYWGAPADSPQIITGRLGSFLSSAVARNVYRHFVLCA